MASNVSTIARSELLLSPGIIQESSLSIRSVFQSPCSSVPSEWFRDDYLFTDVQQMIVEMSESRTDVKNERRRQPKRAAAANVTSSSDEEIDRRPRKRRRAVIYSDDDSDDEIKEPQQLVIPDAPIVMDAEPRKGRGIRPVVARSEYTGKVLSSRDLDLLWYAENNRAVVRTNEEDVKESKRPLRVQALLSIASNEEWQYAIRKYRQVQLEHHATDQEHTGGVMIQIFDIYNQHDIYYAGPNLEYQGVTLCIACGDPTARYDRHPFCPDCQVEHGDILCPAEGLCGICVLCPPRTARARYRRILKVFEDRKATAVYRARHRIPRVLFNQHLLNCEMHEKARLKYGDDWEPDANFVRPRFALRDILGDVKPTTCMIAVAHDATGKQKEVPGHHRIGERVIWSPQQLEEVCNRYCVEDHISFTADGIEMQESRFRSRDEDSRSIERDELALLRKNLLKKSEDKTVTVTFPTAANTLMCDASGKRQLVVTCLVNDVSVIQDRMQANFDIGLTQTEVIGTVTSVQKMPVVSTSTIPTGNTVSYSFNSSVLTEDSMVNQVDSATTSYSQRATGSRTISPILGHNSEHNYDDQASTEENTVLSVPDRDDIDSEQLVVSAEDTDAVPANEDDVIDDGVPEAGIATGDDVIEEDDVVAGRLDVISTDVVVDQLDVANQMDVTQSSTEVPDPDRPPRQPTPVIPDHTIRHPTPVSVVEQEGSQHDEAGAEDLRDDSTTGNEIIVQDDVAQVENEPVVTDAGGEVNPAADDQVEDEVRGIVPDSDNAAVAPDLPRDPGQYRENLEDSMAPDSNDDVTANAAELNTTNDILDAVFDGFNRLTTDIVRQQEYLDAHGHGHRQNNELAAEARELVETMQAAGHHNAQFLVLPEGYRPSVGDVRINQHMAGGVQRQIYSNDQGWINIGIEWVTSSGGTRYVTRDGVIYESASPENTVTTVGNSQPIAGINHLNAAPGNLDTVISTEPTLRERQEAHQAAEDIIRHVVEDVVRTQEDVARRSVRMVRAVQDARRHIHQTQIPVEEFRLGSDFFGEPRRQTRTISRTRCYLM